MLRAESVAFAWDSGGADTLGCRTVGFEISTGVFLGGVRFWLLKPGASWENWGELAALSRSLPSSTHPAPVSSHHPVFLRFQLFRLRV